MATLPYYYEQLNDMRGHRIPAGNVCYASETYYYFWRSLYQRLNSRFKWTVPDTWDKEVFEFALYSLGFLGIFDTNKYAGDDPKKMYGIIPAPATVSGVGVQMQPTEIRTANPHFYMTSSEVIYEGAGLIKLTGDYKGILDIVDFYAERLATLFSTIDQSIINSRFAYIVSANSTTASATLKAIFDARNSGKPLIVFDKNKLKSKDASKTSAIEDQDPFEVMDLHVGQNYITDKLLLDYRAIMHEFDMEIGIPNNPYEKAERLVTNEIESNSAETVARSEYWMDCLNRSIKKTKEVFPDLELLVEFRNYDTGNTGAKEAGKVVNDVSETDDKGTS